MVCALPPDESAGSRQAHPVTLRSRYITERLDLGVLGEVKVMIGMGWIESSTSYGSMSEG